MRRLVLFAFLAGWCAGCGDPSSKEEKPLPAKRIPGSDKKQ